MPDYRLIAPYIRWGTNFANAVYFPFPLDNPQAGSEPRDGSEFDASPSGIEDAWVVGTDYLLEGDHRWIPQSDTLFYPRATGFDGSIGVREFLGWARGKNAFKWHPDGRNLLRAPKLDSAAVTGDGGFGRWSTASEGGLTGVTNAFDAGETAWKLAATNPTGGQLNARIFQYVPSTPGESAVLSVDYKASGLSGGASGAIEIHAASSVPADLATLDSVTGLTATGYTRADTGMSSAAPANTAYLLVLLFLILPAGAAGTIFYKNAMLRRDSTDATFIDNPSVDGCYLVEPLKGAPPQQGDGSRIIRLRIRNPTTPFEGY